MKFGAGGRRSVSMTKLKLVEKQFSIYSYIGDSCWDIKFLLICDRIFVTKYRGYSLERETA